MTSNIGEYGETVQDAMSRLRASILGALDVYEEHLRALVGQDASLEQSTKCKLNGQRTDEAIEDDLRVRSCTKSTVGSTATCEQRCQMPENASSEVVDLQPTSGNDNNKSILGNEPVLGLPTPAAGIAPQGAEDAALALTRSFEAQATGAPVVALLPDPCSRRAAVDGPPLHIQDHPGSSEAEKMPSQLEQMPSQLEKFLPVLCSDKLAIGSSQGCSETKQSSPTPSVDVPARSSRKHSTASVSSAVEALKLMFSKQTPLDTFENDDMLLRRASTSKSIIGISRKEEMIRKGRIHRMVKSEKFEYAFGFVIFLNGIFLGVKADHRVTHMGDELAQTWRLVDIVFLAVFSIELVLRIIGERFDFFLDPEVRTWNMFDLFVVAVPIVEEIISQTSQGRDNGPSTSTSSSLRILRVLKNVRVIRMARLMRIFQELRLMLTSIVGAVKSLCWACLLLLVIMWVLAIFFIEGSCDYLQDNPERGQDMNIWYGSLGTTLLTLFMSICGGVDWSEPAYAIEHAGMHFLVTFVAYVAFIQFAVLNIVTGIFLQRANSTAARDLDNLMQEDALRKKSLRADIIQLFREGDKDESGGLTMDELEEYLKNSRVRTFFAMLNLDIPAAIDFFHVLDADNSGIVDIQEWVEGCMRLRGNPKSIDMINTLRLTKRLIEQMDRLLEAQSAGRKVKVDKPRPSRGWAESSERQQDREPRHFLSAAQHDSEPRAPMLLC